MEGAPPAQDVPPAMAEPEGERAEAAVAAPAAGEEVHRRMVRSASQTLSTEDVVEISKFNAGKERIEQHIALLEGRPRPLAFADFLSAENAPAEEVWATLDGQIEQVHVWIDERDEIEQQAEEWNVADMERLRRVSKAASERHMSAQDTDLVEVALGTLIALDKLLHLLSSRRIALNLMSARLAWEAHRRTCWTTFRTLAHDIDAFVAQKARWSPAVYHSMPGASSAYNSSSSIASMSQSISGSSLAGSLTSSVTGSATGSLTDSPVTSRRRDTVSRQRLVERLDHEAARLDARIRPFAHETVPRSGEALDRIIEEHQVPEQFLDEQDRLEDLAAAMSARGLFLRELVAQWHQADELYNAQRDLNAAAKTLQADLDAAQVLQPDAARAETFAQRAATMVEQLEALAGPATQVFLHEPSASHASLRLSSQRAIILPSSEALWPEQATLNANLASLLTKELGSAGKHVRRAVQASQRHMRALQAYQDVARLRSELAAVSEDCAEIERLAREGWSETSPGSDGPSDTPSKLKDGSPPDLCTVACLDPAAHDLFAARFPRLKPRLASTEAAGLARVDSLTKGVLTCIREGLAQSTFRRDVDQAISGFRKAHQAATVEVGRATAAIEALKAARSCAQSLETVRKGAEELVAELLEAGVPELRGPEASGQGPGAHLGAGQKRCSALSARLAEAASMLDAFARRQTAQDTSAVQLELQSSHERTGAAVSDADALLKWLAASQRQRDSLASLARRHDELSHSGSALKRQLQALLQADTASELLSDSPSCIPAELEEERAKLTAATQLFAESLPASLPFTGPPPRPADVRENGASTAEPHLLLPPKGTKHRDLASNDDDARAQGNAWAAQLLQLADELASAFDDARGAFEAQHKVRQEAAALAEARALLAEAVLSVQQSYAAAEACVVGSHTLLNSALNDERTRYSVASIEEAHHSAGDDIAQVEKQVGDALIELDRREAQILSLDANAASQDAAAAAEAREGEARFTVQRGALFAAFAAALDAALSHEADRLARAKQEAEEAQLREQAAERAAAAAAAAAAMEIAQAADAAAEIIDTPEKLPSSPLPSPSTLPPNGSLFLASPEPDAALSTRSSDVFGPTSSAKPDVRLDDGQAQDSVRQQVTLLLQSFEPDAVDEQTIPDGLAQKRRMLLLPFSDEADGVMAKWVAQKRAVATLLAEPAVQQDWPEVEELRQASAQRATKVRRFSHLSVFASQAARLELELGAFVDLLDQNEPGRAPPSAAHDMTSNGRDTTSAIVDRLALLQPLLQCVSAALDPVSSDIRVVNKMSDLNRLFNETRAMAQDFLSPEPLAPQDEEPEACYSPASATSSLPSTAGSSLSDRDAAGSASERDESGETKDTDPQVITAPDRFKSHMSTSSTVSLLSPAPTKLQRSARRVASDSKQGPATQATPRASKLRAPATPRATAPTALEPRVPSSAAPRPTSRLATSSPSKPSLDLGQRRLPSVLTTPRGSKLPVRAPSTASQAGSAEISRSNSRSDSRSDSRATSRTVSRTTPRKAPVKRPNAYKPNPKSRLDVAVSRIVNQMPVPVQISHAASGVEARASETWNDESGRYWVGHRDPRLCFCRFLRSRIVMVRIGGGWQELSSYIQHHYSELSPQGELSPPRQADLSALPWLSSASLAHSASVPAQRSAPVRRASATSDASPSPEAAKSAFLRPLAARRSSASGGPSRSGTPTLLQGRRSVTPSAPRSATPGLRRSITPGPPSSEQPERRRAGSAVSTAASSTGSVKRTPKKGAHPFPYRSPMLPSTPQGPVASGSVVFPSPRVVSEGSPEQMIPLFLRREDASAHPHLQAQPRSASRSRRSSRPEGSTPSSPAAGAAVWAAQRERVRRTSAAPPLPSPAL